MASQDQKIEWLADHGPYELGTMRHALETMIEASSRLRNGTGQDEFNAAFETFSVKARSLADFLADKNDNRNFNSKDFEPAMPKPDRSTVQGLLNRFEGHSIHMGKLRSKEPGNKIALGDCLRLANWIDTHMQAFIDSLPDKWWRHWNGSIAGQPVRASPGSIELASTTTSATTICVGAADTRNPRK